MSFILLTLKIVVRQRLPSHSTLWGIVSFVADAAPHVHLHVGPQLQKKDGVQHAYVHRADCKYKAKEYVKRYSIRWCIHRYTVIGSWRLLGKTIEWYGYTGVSRKDSRAWQKLEQCVMQIVTSRVSWKRLGSEQCNTCFFQIHNALCNTGHARWPVSIIYCVSDYESLSHFI